MRNGMEYSNSNRPNRRNQSLIQRERILALLRSKPKVPSYELAEIALQYGARILELRRQGYQIVNETKTVDGQKHGTFELVSEPEPLKLTRPPVSEPPMKLTPESVSTGNFLAYEMGRERGRR